jgi:8-oxo-dGTP pyrophosphatase MutT (NUDIX family)
MVELKNWWAGGILLKVEDGHLKTLVQKGETILPKHAWQGTQIKFPGGDSLPGETNFVDTLRREFFEETGLLLRKGVAPRHIYKQNKGDGHRQIFYYLFMSDLEGTLRTKVMFDGTSRLEPPEWVLIDRYFLENVNGLYRTHKPALKKLLTIRPEFGIFARELGLMK